MRLPRLAPARVVPRAGGRLLRLAYVAVVAAATLRGLAPNPDAGMAAARLWRALHPTVRASDAVDAARNVVLFAGFGAVWLATAAPGRLRRALVRATVVGAALSAAVEGAQLFSPARWASMLDVVTNTTGAFAGAFAVALAVAATRAPRAVPLAPPPLALAALPYAAACALEAFSPLGRADQLAAAAGGPAARWATAVAHLRAAPPALRDALDVDAVLLFAPAGVLATLYWVERGGRARDGAVAATAGLAAAWAGAEVLRGIAGGEMSPWAAVARGAASGLGAATAAAALTVGSAAAGVARVRALIARSGAAGFAAVLLLWSWRPFTPEGAWAGVAAKFGGRAFVPLAALADDYTLHSVADVAVGFLLYVPVGAWMCARRAGAATVWSLWPGFVLAMVAEGGQAGIAGRTVDVTDVLVQGAGVFLGWAVVRQAQALRAAGWGAGGRAIRDGLAAEGVGVGSGVVATA